MFAIIENDSVIHTISEDHITAAQLAAKYPHHKVMIAQHGIPANLLRVYQDRAVPKVAAVMSLNRTSVKANGIDEILLTIKLYDLQPDEKVEKLTLSIDEQLVEIDIEDNHGSAELVTNVRGLHIVDVVDKFITTVKVAFEAT